MFVFNQAKPNYHCLNSTTLSQDSENVQCNLEIAKLFRLRETYTFSVNSSHPLLHTHTFVHTLSLQCSKERNNVDIPRLLTFLSRLTTCPPMVYALKLLYENSYLKLPCWVSVYVCSLPVCNLWHKIDVGNDWGMNCTHLCLTNVCMCLCQKDTQ